jgi:hypothetical protein
MEALMVGVHALRRRLLIVGAVAAGSIFSVASWAQTSLDQIPQPPVGRLVPHGPLSAYAIINGLMTAAVVILLVRDAWRTRSAFPLAFLVAGALAGLVEPIYDGNIHVWFAQPSETAAYRFYNVPYPWYEMPGNSVLGGPIYWMYLQFQRGITARGLWGYFVLWSLFDTVWEIPGTTMEAYAYYGPQPFLLSGFPLWVGMLAGLGLPLAGYTAHALRGVLAGARLWLMVVILVPVVIYGSEVIAWPMWITLNGGQGLVVTRLAALVSLAFTISAYYFLTLTYAKSRAMPAAAGAAARQVAA